MQLKDFYDYKNRIMEDLLTNERVVKLIDRDATLETAGDLVYDQVFPYEFVPETVQDGRTFVCCDVDIQKGEPKTFYYPTIYVWVFCHKSQLRLPEGGVRTDELCAEICNMLNGSRMYGLGELDLYASRRFAPMTDYQGKCLVFHAKEFGKVHEQKFPVPDNRKAQ